MTANVNQGQSGSGQAGSGQAGSVQAGSGTPHASRLSRGSAVPLATYSRSGMVEGVFYGHAVIVDPSGEIAESWGSTTELFYPRSSNKIAQASGMRRLGLDLPAHLQAMTAASHSGEEFHIAAIREILELAQCDESALKTPADYPLDRIARHECIARGIEAAPILMNCSGKHAGMIATSVLNNFDVEDYLDVDGSLQQALQLELENMAGERVTQIGVDGCGAPLLALTLPGLARIAQSAVTADVGSPRRVIADVMRQHPEFVGGTRRDVTHFMQRIPGLLAKDGADGVYVAAFEDGRAIALKMEDGTDRSRNTVMAGLLARMGVRSETLRDYLDAPIYGGGAIVGSIRPTLSP